MESKVIKVQLTPQSGLILEGGGMRGVFTCGVLDNLMERGIRFPYTIGVSAGACNGLSYIMVYICNLVAAANNQALQGIGIFVTGVAENAVPDLIA